MRFLESVSARHAEGRPRGCGMREALVGVFALRGDAVMVARLHVTLGFWAQGSGRPARAKSDPPAVAAEAGAPASEDSDPYLAADLIEALRGQPLGLSGTTLAVRVHRGKARVLAKLRHDDRFVMTGRGRGCRWRTPDPEPNGTGREAIRHDSITTPSFDPTQRVTRAQAAS
jgi:hypothetical protein